MATATAVANGIRQASASESGLIHRYAEAKAAYEKLATELKELRGKLLEAIGEDKGIASRFGVVSKVVVQGKRIDTRRLKAEFPEIAEEVSIEYTQQQLRFKVR